MPPWLRAPLKKSEPYTIVYPSMGSVSMVWVRSWVSHSTTLREKPSMDLAAKNSTLLNSTCRVASRGWFNSRMRRRRALTQSEAEAAAKDSTVGMKNYARDCKVGWREDCQRRRHMDIRQIAEEVEMSRVAPRQNSLIDQHMFDRHSSNFTGQLNP